MRTSFFGLAVLAVTLAAGAALVAADDDKDRAIKKDRKIYDGTWRVVSLVIDGKDSQNNDTKFTVINQLDGSWSLQANGNEISKGTSQIDPTKKLKTIDFTPTKGAGEAKNFLGIYELGEKTRKLCFVESGTDRPTEFSSEAGSKRVLATFERVKAE